MTDPRIAYFDDMAPTWDNDGPTAEEMIACLQRHADRLALTPGKTLLELGCGTGKTTAWLAEQVAPGRVTAVDFAPGMIAAAQAKGIDATFRCADICCDDLGDAAFDVVFCFHCFPHLRDQTAALANMASALKPDGRLIVMHMRGSRHINSFHATLDAPVNIDVLPSGEAAWDALLESAGLRRNELIDRDDLFFLRAVRQ
ncbi:MAG: methyltransferase domain-containing protein [Planctomycetes bacterium]|jgi:ubiquinone/menaquinone biosynthesis C-methylase UbiE|nr:methyltransferase domain-containing protein [Phycisphaerae bacterium]NBB94125.1 methyltransferase domain-containing protein [Planctomycetota bacterium]